MYIRELQRLGCLAHIPEVCRALTQAHTLAVTTRAQIHRDIILLLSIYQYHRRLNEDM